MYAEAILRAYGIDQEKDITALTAESPAKGLEYVADGRADATIDSLVGPKMKKHEDRIGEIIFLPFDEARIGAVQEMVPGFSYAVMPVGWTVNKQDVPCVAAIIETDTNKNVDEGIIYTYLKTIDEHYDEVTAIHKLLTEWSLERAVRPFILPFHTGAIKYYKEKGIWTSEQEKLNKEGLARIGQ
jgi:TRAP transporter TAXI family solute receptor